MTYMALPCTVYSAAISPINYRSLHIPYIGLVVQPITMPTRKIFLQLSLTPTCSSLFLYHTCKIPIPLFPNHTTSTLLNCNLRSIYQFLILSHTILRRTKETFQYRRRNLPNMERTRSVHIKHLCIISMSPLYVLGSM